MRRVKRRSKFGRKRSYGKRSFRRVPRRVASKRRFKSARRTNVRTGVHSYKLYIEEDQIRSVASSQAPFATGATSLTADNGTGKGDQFILWAPYLAAFRGFTALCNVHRQFRIRGFSMSFRPNWTNTILGDTLTGIDEFLPPKFLYKICRDPSSLPYADRSSAGGLLQVSSNVRTHNFLRGKTLRVFVKWPTLPAQVFTEFVQGVQESSQWTEPVFTQGKPTWLPTGSNKAITAKHLGMWTAFEDPWVGMADPEMHPKIKISCTLWVDFKDTMPGWQTSGTIPVVADGDGDPTVIEHTWDDYETAGPPGP